MSIESAESERREFGVRQAEMTSQWYENVKQRERNVGAYILKRKNSYLDRWCEAARFISDASSVLDVGGGNIYPELITYIQGRKFNYWYLDVDPAAVNSSRRLAEQQGLDGGRFFVGFNDKFDFHDESFDAVFSSHCLEHSFDVDATFSELFRIIKDGGNLLMAVPLGWEANPEHPYFFGPDEWIALVEDAGFTIRVAQIGFEYPENGCDFFISARKDRSNNKRHLGKRVKYTDYKKENFTFIDHRDGSIKYEGEFSPTRDGIICKSDSWSISVDLPQNTKEILPIFVRHNWSGIVEISDGIDHRNVDLYSWFKYTQPARFIFKRGINSYTPQDRKKITIRPVGRNLLSRSYEGVISGFLVR